MENWHVRFKRIRALYCKRIFYSHHYSNCWLWRHYSLNRHWMNILHFHYASWSDWVFICNRIFVFFNEQYWYSKCKIEELYVYGRLNQKKLQYWSNPLWGNLASDFIWSLKGQIEHLKVHNYSSIMTENWALCVNSSRDDLKYTFLLRKIKRTNCCADSIFKAWKI